MAAMASQHDSKLLKLISLPGATITSEKLSQREAIVPHLHLIYQSHTERFVLLVNRNWLTSQTDLISNYRKTLNILQTIVPAFYLPGLFQM